MTIPIIDFSIYNENQQDSMKTLSTQIEQACSQVGFLALSNSGISSDLLRDVFQLSRTFFNRPLAEKNESAYINADANFGYQSFGMEKLMPGGQPDLKETLTMRDMLNNQNSLPFDSAANHTLIEFYQQAMNKAYEIMRIFAHSLKLDSDFFVSRHNGVCTTLRMLRYPAVDHAGAAQFGAGEHTDYGMMTLLFQDDVGGLEVKNKRGEWVSVPANPSNIVINCGDLLQRWTNNRFASTPHRVLPNFATRPRYSIALFVDPDPDVIVECLPSCIKENKPAIYPPTHAGQFIQQKILATHR